MNNPPKKKISWAMLVVIAGCTLILKSYVEPSGNTAKVPLTIDVSKEFEDPERKATTDLTPSELVITTASENPRTTKAEYTYSPSGILTSYIEYNQYTDIEKGLLWGRNGLSGATVWKVNSSGEKTAVRVNSYTHDKNGLVTKETIDFSQGNSMETDYTRTADGQESVVSIYARDADDDLSLVSTATYQYSDNGNLVSSTLTYPGDSSKTVRTTYISNTNGSPVKIVSKNVDGKVVSTETRGYNKDGTIAYSKTCNSAGKVLYQTWYYYDNDGYLEESAEFGIGAGGALEITAIKTYEYFDW